MDETTIKTNLGIILQGVLAKAIEQAGFTAIQDYQYDSTCERPDFLIPDQKKPRYMIEVHQTEARDSFRMKVLRAFTAVTESKAFYGDDLIAVNILFGDPDSELPSSNIRAMCGVFDVNLIPRKDATDKLAITSMEADALTFASNENYKNKTAQAAKDLISLHGSAISTLAAMMSEAFGGASAKSDLFPMWQMERTRTSKLGKPPSAGHPTYFKRGLLGSLFLSDAGFEELLTKADLNLCSPDLQRQIVSIGLGSVEELVDGDQYSLDSQFSTFLSAPKAAQLRALCVAELEVSNGSQWFFEDIRSRERRERMTSEFLGALSLGRQAVIDQVLSSLAGQAVGGIQHSRCWPADLMALLVKHSQNDFNRRMVQSGRDPENYQYPFNHITGRFERLLSCPQHFNSYATYAVEIFEEVCKEEGIDSEYLESAENWLPNKLLDLRLNGAIKLQKFNPLYACLVEICADYGISVRADKVKSITFDLAGGRGRLGKYDTLVIGTGGRSVMALAIAVHDSHGDDKSKEWGARRLASLYRIDSGKVLESEFMDGLLLLDGEWEDKDVARLYRCGWSHICRLDQLEDTLKQIFGLKAKVKAVKSKSPMVTVEDVANDG